MLGGHLRTRGSIDPENLEAIIPMPLLRVVAEIAFVQDQTRPRGMVGIVNFQTHQPSFCIMIHDVASVEEPFLLMIF